MWRSGPKTREEHCFLCPGANKVSFPDMSEAADFERQCREFDGGGMVDRRQLIEDLLEFSRAARAEIKRQRVSVQALVADVFAELQTETADRNICWKAQDLAEVE